MPSAKLRSRGRATATAHYLHSRQVAKAKEAIEAASAASTQLLIPPEWLSFESFAQHCRTRQRDGIKGLILYEWQIRVLALLDEHGSVVITKSRQVGGSQAFIMLALHQALTKPGFMGLIASKRTDDAMQLARRVRRALKGLNTPIKPVNDSLSQLVLSNESQILFRSSSPADSLSRSIDTLDFALADEYSFWQDGQEEALGSLAPAMANSANPQLIIVSTPNGQSDDYWKKLSSGIGAAAFEAKLQAIREGAEEPYQEIVVPGKIPVAICHWKAIPHYAADPDFKKKMVSKLGLTETKWAREFDLNFAESEESVFDFALVQSCLGREIDKSWHPDPEVLYWIGVDPSGITGGDYTAAVVLEESGNHYLPVEIFRKRTGTAAEHLSAISKLAQKWKPVQITVESNGVGATWAEQLSGLNLAPKIVKLPTTASSKPMLISRVKLGLERGEVEIPPGSILEQELLSFRQSGKAMQAAQGGTDDVLMALCLAAAPSGLNAAIQRLSVWQSSADDSTNDFTLI
jgi:hypothetical protein